MNELSIRSNLKTTVNQLIKLSKFGVPSKPVIKVREDGMIVGVITETNQFVPLVRPEEDIDLHSIETQDGKNTALDIDDVAKLLKHQNELILRLQKQLEDKNYEIKLLNEQGERCKNNRNCIELLENPIVPIDISYGMFLEISENDILAQINNIN